MALGGAEMAHAICFDRLGVAVGVLFLLQSVAASGTAVAAHRKHSRTTPRPPIVQLSTPVEREFEEFWRAQVPTPRARPVQPPTRSELAETSVAADEKDCFRIVPSNGKVVMDFNVGSVLLNTCTGETWLLMSEQDNAVRWHLIKKVRDEPVSASTSD
jgi:hypothetical protein